MKKFQLRTDGLQGETLKFVQNLNEQFNSMPDAVTVDDVNTQIRSTLKGMTKEDGTLAFKAEELLELLGESEKGIRSMLAAQGLKIKALEEGGERNKVVSSYEHIMEQLVKHKDDLAACAAKRDGGFQFSIRASNSLMTTDYSSSAPNTYMPVPKWVGDIHTPPEVAVTIMDLVSMGTSDSPTIVWVNEKPIEGDAAWTPENGLKAQVAWKYENETANAKKVTAFVKVTKESMSNLKFLANRINTRLRELIMRKIQDGILNGDGLNDSPEGITPNVPGYTTLSFNASVDNPNTMDALMAMAGQIDELEFETGSLVAVMNGVDIRKMKWVKDANGQYIIPPFVTASGTYVDNMRVVKNNKIAAGYALVGDLKKFEVLMVEDVTIDVGLDGNDFTYNRRTILAEARLITMLSDVDKGAFVYDAIADVKTAIDATV